MDINSINRLGRIEHDQRVHSLRPVPEFDLPAIEQKSNAWQFSTLLRPILTMLLHLVMR